MLKFNHGVFQIVHVAKSGGIQMISNGQQCSNLPALHHQIGLIQRPSFKFKVICTLYKKYKIYIQGYRYRYVMRKPPHHLQLEQCVHAQMQCGQTMSAIGISNSNQSDLVQCVYSTTCSFPNHTAHISVIFMHAWVSNIMISYSNI